jgi:glycosyltransferase involved in cell wall biosynthesis
MNMSTLQKDKLIVIANSYYPVGTANSINVFRMLATFHRRGYHVSLIARRSFIRSKKKIWDTVQIDYGEKVSANVFLLWWPFLKYSEIIFSIYSLLHLLLTSKKVIIYTRVRYVAFISGKLNFKTAFESHIPPQNALTKKLDRWLASRKNCKIILISEGLNKAYRDLGFSLKHPIIAPDAGRLLRKSVPRKEEFHGECSNIGYIGSMYPGRGIELILMVANVMKNKRFHLVGDTSSFNLAQKIPSNVFFYGKMSPHQAELITSLFDILLMPYQEKVMVGNGLDTSKWMSPMKLFEYMLSGKPIISSDMPAIKEILTNKVNAYLVRPSKVSDWCSAIEEMDDSGFRYEISKNAFNEAREKYTWERRVDKILSHL